MEPDRAYQAQDSRDAVVNAIPALFMFLGSIGVVIILVADPSTMVDPGGLALISGLLFGSLLFGFLVRAVIPRGDDGPTELATRTFGLVIFDCDGVLVDSEALTVEVEARVLGALGWAMQPTEVARRWVGKSLASQLADIEERLGPEAAKVFDEQTEAEVRKVFERSLTPVDGVRPLLDRLDTAEMPYCVASSGTHDKMRLTLGITGLTGRFQGRTFSDEDVEHGKPAPDLFLHAAKELGVKPENCAVIEDSVYGVQAAVAAGMTVYGYAGGLTDPRQLAQAGAVIFHAMGDLGTFLGIAEPEPEPLT